jgi:cytoplasmic iron level regulating protein YaaA (DUF328/UPF0246 family)
MLTLLSPAKSLDYESSIYCSDFTIPHFEKETKNLSLELKKFAASDLEKLMGISPKLAQLNFDRFQKFSPKITLQNAKQALLVFDGDVYKTIGKEKFDNADFEFAQNNLRILSGFYGILKPLDLMQPYRLEMGTDFKKTVFEKDLKIKNLYQFWGDKISNYLELECSKSNSKYIINLASEEYFSAVNPKKITAKIINIFFKEKKNGAYKIIGINAKKARGLMTNFIVKNRISNPKDLKNFNFEKYQFSAEMSDETNFTFIRD